MIGDSLNTWNSTISDHKFYCRISQEFYLYVSCFALFPFFMLQIRLSCVILPKRVYLPLILNVNFFQLFPFHKGSQSGRFFTPDQTLLWICISTRSQTVEVYMLDRCVNWNAMKSHLLHTVCMLQKKSSSSDSVCQSELPTKYIKHQ